jgi:hypothetical protein
MEVVLNIHFKRADGDLKRPVGKVGNTLKIDLRIKNNFPTLKLGTTLNCFL